MKIVVAPKQNDPLATIIHSGMHLLTETYGSENAAHISINLLMHVAIIKELHEKDGGQTYLDEIAKDLMGSFREAFESMIKEHPDLLDKVKELKERREVA